MIPSGNPVPETLHLYIDESGNFDFSSRGSKHFVMAGITALAPLDSAAQMQALRYRLLSEGHNIETFHAAPDAQFVRDAVFETLMKVVSVKAHVIFGEKSKIDFGSRTDVALHSKFATELLWSALDTYPLFAYDRVVIIFDQALPEGRQKVFHASVKPILKKINKPFQLYFQSMKVDMNGQIADYVAWSKFVALERGEMRPWESLSKSLKPTAQEILGG